MFIIIIIKLIDNIPCQNDTSTQGKFYRLTNICVYFIKSGTHSYDKKLYIECTDIDISNQVFVVFLENLYHKLKNYDNLGKCDLCILSFRKIIVKTVFVYSASEKMN